MSTEKLEGFKTKNGKQLIGLANRFKIGSSSNCITHNSDATTESVIRDEVNRDNWPRYHSTTEPFTRPTIRKTAVRPT